jgi:hypothetical protein
MSPTATAAPATPTTAPSAATPSTVHPVMAFLDRSILRERRLEALWKRASRGAFEEEVREDFQFEAYEDREHARILRRHRATVARALGVERRAPGSRATKVGRTFTPKDALAEALFLKVQARADYAAFGSFIQDRFLRKFVEVLASSEKAALERLAVRARELGVRPVAPGARRPSMTPVAPRDGVRPTVPAMATVPVASADASHLVLA